MAVSVAGKRLTGPWAAVGGMGASPTTSQPLPSLVDGRPATAKAPREPLQCDCHFLYLLVKNKDLNKEYHVRSPKYVKSGATCRLTFWVHMYMEQPEAREHKKFLDNADRTATDVLNRKAQEGNIKVVIETGSNKTQWVFHEILGNDHNRWENETVNIGSQAEFTILLVVTPGRKQPLHVALDNITLANCFQDQQLECQAGQFQCANNSACISYDNVCDIEKDCPDGEDEEQDCDKVPAFARCDFESGMCGWRNKEGRDLNWKQKNGSLTVTGSTGPSFDHTYKNATGMYIYVDMTGTYKMGTASELESPILNPPPKYHSNISSPYYNSCIVSFFYHKFGPHSGSLGLFLVELQREANNTQKVWWGYGTKTDKWLRTVVRLPHNITGRYYLLFEARKSYASRGDPALDDFAMSPRCFGKGVPASHLEGYDYDKFQHGETPEPPVTHKDFVNATVYQFTNCGATGRKGPSQQQCDEAYNNTEVEVTVQTEKIMAGIQKWVVPEGGFYTIIAKGASGGRGSDGQAPSRGALVRTVVELKKGQQIFILVGQEGTRSCPKDSFFLNYPSSRKSLCDTSEGLPTPTTYDRDKIVGRRTKVHEISRLTFLSEGGGGGGATYVFTILKNKEKRPLVVAGGGGGLGHGSNSGERIHHGHPINRTLAPISGETIGNVPAGAGGGWKGGNATGIATNGVSLEHGSEGGSACYKSRNGSDMGAGGFGGGGGGCTAGGGGGGYAGGRAWAYKAGVGEGGYSWIEGGFLHRVSISPKIGPGEVLIIPAIQGCDCDYLCVALDPYRATTQCLCPDNWHLSNDSVQCIMNPSTSALSLPTAFLLAILLVFVVAATVFVIYLYSRYLKKKNAMIRRKMLSGPDLQLNRLRVASDSMMTEYNPNYEFGGGVYSLRDLKEIPREHLRLVKALGQGAFGEVYQGLYKHRVGDAVEMPVAVKELENDAPGVPEGKILVINGKEHPAHLTALLRQTVPGCRLIIALKGDSDNESLDGCIGTDSNSAGSDGLKPQQGGNPDLTATNARIQEILFDLYEWNKKVNTCLPWQFKASVNMLELIQELDSLLVDRIAPE
ncbi:hypothetical protein GE061_009578 [Apolygus lucorum]|uniref:receptor protein-tyrosine kinase n=1 Tax=Apolygus lucorum TaxID=248454 RepID=A0A8S9Y4Q3_APOLU|nr:hypothetical protein GE061_009578 [Apolygus lucorum]